MILQRKPEGIIWFVPGVVIHIPYQHRLHFTITGFQLFSIWSVVFLYRYKPLFFIFLIGNTPANWSYREVLLQMVGHHHLL